MYLRGETHLRLCTLSSPPSEKTSGGRNKYLIPPVSGGSNRHRLTAPKGRIPPCVFYKRPEKSLARCPQVRRLPCGFFIILPLERFVKSILPFLPLHTRRDSACSPPPANQARQPHAATNPHLPNQQKLPPCPRHAQKAKQNSASQVAGTWGKFSVSEGGLEGRETPPKGVSLRLQGLPYPLKTSPILNLRSFSIFLETLSASSTVSVRSEARRVTRSAPDFLPAPTCGPR